MLKNGDGERGGKKQDIVIEGRRPEKIKTERRLEEMRGDVKNM